MENCNGRKTPLDPGSFPRREEMDDESINPTERQSLARSINFLVTFTQVYHELRFPLLGWNSVIDSRCIG